MILTGDYDREFTNLLALDTSHGFMLTRPACVQNAHRFTLNPTDAFDGESIFDAGTRGYLLGELTELYPGLHRLGLRPLYVVTLGLDVPCQLILDEHAITFVPQDILPVDVVRFGLYLQAFPEGLYQALLEKNYDAVSHFRMNATMPGAISL